MNINIALRISVCPDPERLIETRVDLIIPTSGGSYQTERNELPLSKDVDS